MITFEKDEVVIRMKYSKKPEPSTSGKTLLVASTGGFTKTGIKLNNSEVSANIVLTIPNGAFVPAQK